MAIDRFTADHLLKCIDDAKQNGVSEEGIKAMYAMRRQAMRFGVYDTIPRTEGDEPKREATTERMKQIQDLAEYAKSRLVVGERPDDVAMAKHAIDVIASVAVDVVGIADSVKRQADACEELAKAMHLQVEILKAQMGGASVPQIPSE